MKIQSSVFFNHISSKLILKCTNVDECGKCQNPSGWGRLGRAGNRGRSLLNLHLYVSGRLRLHRPNNIKTVSMSWKELKKERRRNWGDLGYQRRTKQRRISWANCTYGRETWTVGKLLTSYRDLLKLKCS